MKGTRKGRREASFFFSSRRRHTSSLRDWSSDVCSSDLRLWRLARDHLRQSYKTRSTRSAIALAKSQVVIGHSGSEWRLEIGRASCRERTQKGGREASPSRTIEIL